MNPIQLKTRPALFAMLAILAIPTFAQADGATLARNKCEHCHGAEGNSTRREIPSIAGLSEEYAISTLRDFAKKDRIGKNITVEGHPETNMNEIAKDLSSEEIKELAEYYSRQTFKARPQPVDLALAKKGKRVYKKRCRRCHEDNGRSVSEDAGRLAGQWIPYLKEELEDFLAGSRQAPKKMAKQLKKTTREDLEALLHFFAAQQ